VEEKKTKKRKELEGKDEPRKTRGVQPDYRHLHDPFSKSEEEVKHDDDEEALIAEVLLVEIEDKFHSLKEAQESPKWPEWESSIRAELKQHQEKGTWELVPKPPDEQILTNKWVFIKKRNKEG